ncbi:Outer membrane protein (Porin) [Burkholderia sp. 8Y]|uniref:porin n=1 Tax=Burkholderia sp. 8Y TaxID=2653133 RepID=UPI0012F1AA75|nr:porin [Burkholderia sp. 8Y]VXC90909.1 Outer membrane protein (Porin) [Burkholderia sp. 8Y]
MKKQTMAVAALAGIVANGASAQTSVTLYGLIDTGIQYQSSSTTLGTTSGGRSAVKMSNGVWQGSRFGLTGKEDIGGGTQVIFTLESSFNSGTGAAVPTNGMFGRRSFVGLSNPAYGTVTIGRQYTSYYTLLVPYSPINWLTGYAGAHPGDIDSMDSSYRANNSVLYVSPSFHGLTVSGYYALGGVPGAFNRGSTWSAAAQYLNGPFGIAAAFLRINNSTLGGGAWGADSTTSSGGSQPGVSALTYGYRNNQAQQRVAVAGGWQFSPAFDISLSYSNVQYIPGVNSGFRDEAIFNTGGAVLHWKPRIEWDLAAGYAYTRATEANGVKSPAHYSQFNLMQYYNLSKRTGLYLLEAYQRASGQTYALSANGVGSIIGATANVGDGMNSTPSSSGSQFVGIAGIIHRF